jgi:hypothetical protein
MYQISIMLLQTLHYRQWVHTIFNLSLNSGWCGDQADDITSSIKYRHLESCLVFPFNYLKAQMYIYRYPYQKEISFDFHFSWSDWRTDKGMFKQIYSILFFCKLETFVTHESVLLTCLIMEYIGFKQVCDLPVCCNFDSRCT